MLPTWQQWKKWSLPSKYGLIGLVLGILGLCPFLWQLVEPKEYNLEDQLLKTRRELLSNIECIDRIRSRLIKLSSPKPCELYSDGLLILIDRESDLINKEQFGEDIPDITRSLVEQYHITNQAILDNRINKIDSQYYSLRDQSFYTKFINWHLGPLYEKHLNIPFRVDEDSFYDFSHAATLWNGAKVRSTHSKGLVFYDFGEYLGVID